MKSVIILLLMTAAVFAVYFFKRGNTNKDIVTQAESDYVVISNTKIEIELAETPEKRILGLSGLENLPHNRGLLFIYTEPGIYGIWMKDMKFSIDVIWISLDKKVVAISKNMKPESFPQVFESDMPAQYILEVNAGFIDENNIEIGQTVEISK
jgi:uncharacterized protein